MRTSAIDPYRLIHTGVALLVLAGAWQCSGPTGKDDEPQLKVEPLVLDFGTERTSLSLTIENAGSGILDFRIQIPSEGWITLSQTDGTVVNTPLSVDVRIDRGEGPGRRPGGQAGNHRPACAAGGDPARLHPPARGDSGIGDGVGLR